MMTTNPPLPRPPKPDPGLGDFPELPEPECRKGEDMCSPEGGWWADLYTADQMRAYVLADRASRAPAQDGWQLVPVEPTFDMQLSGSTQFRGPGSGHFTDRMDEAKKVWAVMLSAAPSAQAPTGKGGAPVADDVRAALILCTEAMEIKQSVTLWERDGDRNKFDAALEAARRPLSAPQAPAAQPPIDQNAPAVRDCIEGWLLLDNVALVPGECVPLQTSAPVTYPILAAIFEAGYKSGRAS